MLTGLAALALLFGVLYWGYRLTDAAARGLERPAKPEKNQSRVNWAKVRHLEAALNIEPMPRINSKGEVLDAGPKWGARNAGCAPDESAGYYHASEIPPIRRTTYRDVFGNEETVVVFGNEETVVEPW